MLRAVLRIWLLWLVSFTLMIGAPGVAEGLSALSGEAAHACRCPLDLQGCRCVNGEAEACHDPQADARMKAERALSQGRPVITHRCIVAEDPALASVVALPAATAVLPIPRPLLLGQPALGPPTRLCGRPSEAPDRPS